MQAAASIWFEVWGVVNPVVEIVDSSRKISDFPGKSSDDLFSSRQFKKLPTFLANFSFFLIKKTKKHAF